ncbi:MAG TPA: sugar-binding transcriptional regulator [Candidatus Competibacteraceae bacterium]|nr:sugar-binding transcriptional regulator [Candidatus Competibacteraceae bacterium]
MEQFDPKRDLAARVAWMYYVEGLTQDQIGQRLNLSRPAAQRMLALAGAEGLIKVRLDHPIRECMELARALCQRYDLQYCDVVPRRSDETSLRPLAVLGAAKLESYLVQERPLVIGISTGRTLRAIVDEVSHVERPQHRLVSLVGIIAPDGSTNPFEAITWLADKTKARSYQLPVPAVADSPQDREHLQQHRLYRLVCELAQSADVSFVGIGTIDAEAPLLKDGFITLEQVNELRAQGAVGEMVGWVFDDQGRPLDTLINQRVTSVPLARPPQRLRIGAACGMAKFAAIRAALRGRWISGLITDEQVARALLEQP